MNETENFYQLSPIDSVERYKAYFDALDWALDNRKEKNIKNIALTGIHGSGKSSILRSYQKYCENKKMNFRDRLKHSWNKLWCNDKESPFLNISLAKFNEKKETNNKNEDLQQLIELSILQQLFYREKYGKLPDSRIKKIRAFSTIELGLKALIGLIFIISLILLTKYEFFSLLEKQFKDKSNITSVSSEELNKLPHEEQPMDKYEITSAFSEDSDTAQSEEQQTDKSSLFYILLAVVIFFVIFVIAYIIYKSIRIFHNLKIIKLNINNAEIHIDSNINKSILNHNLDEILYFFEVTNYNVVIIEDLDRFEKTEIFTKLREINLLVNNSKKIKRCVVFIYALHDNNMFSDKDKIKFFDFIIPVIPVIHTSNSKEILQKNIKNIVSKELIEIISESIDEMRLLNNIVNEFNIYEDIQFLNAKLLRVELLTKIAYRFNELIKKIKLLKNKLLIKIDCIYFELLAKIKSLQDNKSKLYQDKLLLEINNIFDELFANIEKVIKQPQGKDSWYKDIFNGLIAIVIKLYQNKKYKIFQDELFAKIKIIKSSRGKESSDKDNLSIEINDILSELCSKVKFINSYQDEKSKSHQDKLFAMIFYKNIYSDDFTKLNQDKGALHKILNSNIIEYIEDKNDEIYKLKEEISKLKISKQNEGKKDSDIKKIEQEISSLELEIIKFVYAKIIEIFYEEKISIEKSDNKPKLICLLLIKGYIDNNYLDYVSLFHEGSLSKNDKNFLLNIKIKLITDFDYNIDNIENLIKKIDIKGFEKEYILNYLLIEFILSNDQYVEQKEAISKLFQNKSDNILNFIIGYIGNGRNKIASRIKKLYNNKICIFDHINNSNIFDEEKKRKYFEIIIKNVDAKDIKEIPKSVLPKMIASNPNGNYNIFKFSYESKIDISKIKELLKHLNIKFNYKIEPDIISKYDINEDMFDYIYENNHYVIKIDLLKIMLGRKDSFNEDAFNKQNYSEIIKLGSDDSLFIYINDNINEYIENVYLELEENTKESEEYLIKFLNNEKLSIENKTKIIQKVETKISYLKEINTVEIKNLLMQASKVETTWKNIIDNYLYNEQELKESLLIFLNNLENAENLSTSRIIDEKEYDENTVKKFMDSLISNVQIDKEAFYLILKSFPDDYNISSENFEFYDKNVYDNVKSLIERGFLKLNRETYEKLKNKFFDLHIRLIEKRRDELSKKLPELILDDKDVILLLKSSALGPKDKEKIVAIYKEKNIANIYTNNEILELIEELIIKENFYDIDKNISQAILYRTTRSVNDKIIIFNKINIMINKANNKFDNDEITIFLKSLNTPYSDIAIKRDSTLPLSGINIELLNILRKKKYIKTFMLDGDEIKISV